MNTQCTHSRRSLEERHLNLIKPCETFSKQLPHDEQLIEQLAEKMRVEGFNCEEPLVLFKKPDDSLLLVEGYHRYYAAKKAGLSKVWTVVIEFVVDDNAVSYVLDRQKLRRQDTEAIILHRLIISELATRGGFQGAQSTGPKLTNQNLADEWDVSLRKVKRIKAKYYEPLPPETKEKVRAGNLSVYEILGPIRAKEDEEESANDQDNAKESQMPSERRGVDTNRALFRQLSLTSIEECSLLKESFESKVALKTLITHIIRNYLTSQIGKPSSKPVTESVDTVPEMPRTSAKQSPQEQPNQAHSHKAPNPEPQKRQESEKEISPQKEKRRAAKGEHPNNYWPEHHLESLKQVMAANSNCTQFQMAEKFQALFPSGELPYTTKAVLNQIGRQKKIADLSPPS